MKLNFFAVATLSMVMAAALGSPVDDTEIHGQFTESSTKRFYLGSGSFFHSAAMQDCVDSFRGQLATIETQEDYDAIVKLIGDVVVTSSWVGVGFVEGDDCGVDDGANRKCWKWIKEDNTTSAINPNLLPWNEQAIINPEVGFDNVFLEVRSKTLNFAGRTVGHRYFCQKVIKSPVCQ